VSTPGRLAALFTTLMLLSTAAFVIGVTVEKNQGHSESETIGGGDVQSTPIILLGAAASLALVGAVLRWPRREVYAVAAVLCLGFALLDGSELAHQLDESAGTVATVAGLALVLHLGAAAVATLAVARIRRDRATPATA